MKRLVIASDCFLPRKDGVAVILNSLIPELAKKYKITVLAPNHGKVKAYKKVRLIRFPLIKRLKAGDFTFCRPNYRAVRRAVNAADIILTHTIGPVGLMAIIAARRAKKPVVAYIHSIEWELAADAMRFRLLTNGFIPLAKLFIREVYNQCNLLLVPSSDVSEKLEKVGVTARKKVVSPGIDAGRFVPPESKALAKAAVGISQNIMVVGFCGRLGREKDLTTLYKAFQVLRKKRKEIVLLIVGSGVRSIEKFFSKKQGVIAPGGTDNVLPYLQAMDVYVLPSLTETTSLATLEAMSCGLAVVCTPVGSLKTYIKNGVNGMLFPKKNFMALSSSVEKLLGDEKLRQRLGRNARNTVVRKFPEKRFIKKMIKVIDSF
ncbi:MAG: glycosyltransferase family 4 protein [Candidatus Woesearchaeota archaeon]